MATCLQPLLTLSEARIQDELWRAEAIAAEVTAYRQRTIHLVLTRIDYVAGLALIALGFHMSDGNLARVLFCAALLRAVCGPVWGILLSR